MLVCRNEKRRLSGGERHHLTDIASPIPRISTLKRNLCGTKATRRSLFGYSLCVIFKRSNSGSEDLTIPAFKTISPRASHSCERVRR